MLSSLFKLFKDHKIGEVFSNRGANYVVRSKCKEKTQRKIKKIKGNPISKNTETKSLDPRSDPLFKKEIGLRPIKAYES